MTATERIEMAEQLKAEGTKLFKNGKFEDALESYEDGTGYIGSDFDDFDIPADQEAQAKACYISCRLNGAQCALKLQENAQAVELCSHVLEKDPGSLKALFRRGTARMHMGEWANAKADFKAANEIDPKSKEVRAICAAICARVCLRPWLAPSPPAVCPPPEPHTHRAALADLRSSTSGPAAVRCVRLLQRWPERRRRARRRRRRSTARCLAERSETIPVVSPARNVHSRCLADPQACPQASGIPRVLTQLIA